MSKLFAWMRDRWAAIGTSKVIPSIASFDPAGPARWVRRFILGGGVVFLILAFTAPLSQGVPTNGFVKVKGNVKTIQHLRGGIVEEFLVRDGDHVVTGQPLIKLNDVQMKAQVGVLEAQLMPTLAVEARLLAERNAATSIKFPEFLLDRTESGSKEIMRSQEQLFQARRRALVAEMEITRESVVALEEQIRGLTAAQKSRREQLRLFRAEHEALKPIFEEGFVPRNRIFELERAMASLEGGISEDISNIARARSQISEMHTRMNLTRENYSKEVETQLAEMQRVVADTYEKLTAVRDDLSRVVLRSPVDGVVTGLAVSTLGAVISPGQKIMDIVPSGVTLVIETQIPVNLIDNVRAGLAVDVNFTALDRTLIPTVSGHLTYVSADRYVDPNRAEITYYTGRVELDESELSRLGKHAPQPGMPVEVVIKTGERTLVGYLLKPVLARFNTAMLDR